MSDCAAERGSALGVLASLQRRHGEREVMLASAGALYVAGCELNWSRVLPAGGRCVSLPTYPWQRERHWLDPIRRAVLPSASDEEDRPTGEQLFYDVIWQPHVPDVNPDGALARRWLIFADDGGTGQALAAAREAVGESCVIVTRPDVDERVWFESLITLKTTPMIRNTTTRRTSAVDSENQPSGSWKKAT